MKKIALLLATVSFATLSQALSSQGTASPYTIHNVATGKEYCQVCAYGAKPAKLIAFGNMNDAAFWADLKKLQVLQTANPKLGVFAQVLDSKDAEAIKAAAEKNGITFPIVVAVEKDWDQAYDVKGVSRTIYYARAKNKIVWTSTGLDDKSVTELEGQIKKDVAS